MRAFAELTYFAGFDWAKDHHDVVIVDRHGQVVNQFTFPHSAEGWQKWQECVRSYPALGVAVETSSGPAVERILESGATVFPINPNSAHSYRERKAPAAPKPTDWTPGALPTDCAPTAMAGGRWRR